MFSGVNFSHIGLIILFQVIFPSGKRSRTARPMAEIMVMALNCKATNGSGFYSWSECSIIRDGWVKFNAAYMVLNNQILKNRNCYNFLDVPGMDYHMCKAVLNPLTPISDQDMIFPHHVKTISSQQVIRMKKNINKRIISWSNTKFS